MKSKKPKFRIGQVVRVKAGYMHQGYFKIIGHTFPPRNKEGDYEYTATDGYNTGRRFAFVEFSIRPLTNRECGVSVA